MAPGHTRPARTEKHVRNGEQEGIFPSFFMGGFECSTFIWKGGERRDYVSLTGHDRHLAKDCERMKELGLGVAREAIRWPFVDIGKGNYDWSSVDALMKELAECRVTPIWDLCHYGFPDGCNPLEEACLERFVAYCRAAAEHVKPLKLGGHFFTPVNEINFASGAMTDMRWFYPWAAGQYHEMKRSLCRMAIEGAKAIREVIPEARMVHVDPIVHTVPPKDRPDLADEAMRKSTEEECEAWDMLAGRKAPELGGSPEVLDIVGVNVYHFNQAQMNEDGGQEVLGPHDPRRKTLSDMLIEAWERYEHHPILIGETSGYQDRRAEWLCDTMEECLIAINAGVNLQGVCLYPLIDIPDWKTGEWAKIGVYDIEDLATCERIPHEPYIQELRRWQRILDTPEHLESDGLGERYGRVQLDEVRRHAHEWAQGSHGDEIALGSP